MEPDVSTHRRLFIGHAVAQQWTWCESRRRLQGGFKAEGGGEETIKRQSLSLWAYDTPPSLSLSLRRFDWVSDTIESTPAIARLTSGTNFWRLRFRSATDRRA